MVREVEVGDGDRRIKVKSTNLDGEVSGANRLKPGRKSAHRAKVYANGLTVVVFRMCGFSERWVAERLGLNRVELRLFCRRWDLPQSVRKAPLGGYLEAIRKLETLEIRVGGESYRMGWSLVEPLMGREVDLAALEQVDDLTRLARIRHRHAMKLSGMDKQEKYREWAETMREVEEAGE